MRELAQFVLVEFAETIFIGVFRRDSGRCDCPFYRTPSQQS